MAAMATLGRQDKGVYQNLLCLLLWGPRKNKKTNTFEHYLLSPSENGSGGGSRKSPGGSQGKPKKVQGGSGKVPGEIQVGLGAVEEGPGRVREGSGQNLRVLGRFGAEDTPRTPKNPPKTPLWTPCQTNSGPKSHPKDNSTRIGAPINVFLKKCTAPQRETHLQQPVRGVKMASKFASNGHEPAKN